MFYKNGVLVGTSSNFGSTDGIDPVIAIQPSNSSSFDRIEFVATAGDNDYLIHSIDYETVELANITAISADEDSSIAIKVDSSLVDTDGSESLSLNISGIPIDAILSDGTHSFTASLGSTTSDITGWDLDNITLDVPSVTQTITHTLSINAISTEGSNADTATNTVNIDLTVLNVVNGTLGNDTIVYQDGDKIDGLSGTDTLLIDQAMTLDFDNISNNVDNIENIDLGANNQDITLDIQDVIDITDNGNILDISGDTNDHVTLDNSDGVWTQEAISSKVGFDQYTATDGTDTATIFIEQNIPVDPS